MRWLVCLAIVIYLVASGIGAREVAGVDVPDDWVWDAGHQTLILNGAGIRSKFFVKVYVGTKPADKNLKTGLLGNDD